MHQKWYYEAEITQLPSQHMDKHFHVRVGWAHATLFRSRPSSNGFITTSGGIGDDLYSIAFDGEHFWFGGEAFQSKTSKGKLQRQEMTSDSPSYLSSSSGMSVSVGDVIGCYLDLSAQEVWFTKNGHTMAGRLRFSHLNDMVTPAISVSNSIRYVLHMTQYVLLLMRANNLNLKELSRDCWLVWSNHDFCLYMYIHVHVHIHVTVYVLYVYT